MSKEYFHKLCTPKRRQFFPVTNLQVRGTQYENMQACAVFSKVLLHQNSGPYFEIDLTYLRRSHGEFVKVINVDKLKVRIWHDPRTNALLPYEIL
jgi:hypothetical protein